uniref:Multiple myeloma tumor-associated protein 2-like N-terminal domain-containing protein n=1 Tax=Babesia bovis TaxID=5865 RepID=A7AMZ6_BABBO|eukprot:XP_001611498.1 hypothetical protein [Babesia bovis T2Bo]
MDIRLSPPREGTRGGREQFKWEDIKNCDNKEREHYLGHSVKIGTVKYKNHFYKHDWYLKNDNKATEGDPNEELQLIKLYEDELMLEMLGSKPKRLMLLKSRPTDVESLRKLVGDGEKPNLPSDGVRLEDTKLKQSNRHTSDCSQRMDAAVVMNAALITGQAAAVLLPGIAADVPGAAIHADSFSMQDILRFPIHVNEALTKCVTKINKLSLEK